MWTYSPRFDTMREAVEWGWEHKSPGVAVYETYRTRKAKKWRTRYTALSMEPVFSRDALLLVGER